MESESHFKATVNVPEISSLVVGQRKKNSARQKRSGQTSRAGSTSTICFFARKFEAAFGMQNRVQFKIYQIA